MLLLLKKLATLLEKRAKTWVIWIYFILNKLVSSTLETLCWVLGFLVLFLNAAHVIDHVDEDVFSVCACFVFLHFLS